jgi:hypothetical protein
MPTVRNRSGAKASACSYGASGYIDPYNFDYGKGMLASDTGHQFTTSLSSTT